MEYLTQRRWGRFAPTHLPGMQARQGAPRQYNAIITQAPHDFVATAEGGKSSKDELQGVLHLSIGVFDDVPIVSPHQSRWQRLAGGTTCNLALPPGIHPQTEDVPFRLAQQPPQAQ